jgi:SAM-dependent methyltransferase
MMFSPEWDDRFRSGGNISQWPWSDLISYVNRYAKPLKDFKRVLELGCAAGPNIPFFLRSGMDYYAIEGSAAIVARLHCVYPELKDRIVVGDFTRDIPFGGPFDLVVDRSSVTHNTTDAIRKTLQMVFDRMRPGGKFLGLDWFSDVYVDANRGEALDTHTRTNIQSGQFVGLGIVHFSDRDHLLDLLAVAGFQVERLEHKQSDVTIPSQGGRSGWWNFVAVRP